MLKINDELPYNRQFLMATIEEDMLYNFILKKTHGKSEHINQYHINITCNVSDKTLNIGYIYFFMNEISKESHFIGMEIKDSFRSKGLGTKLIAAWIKFCWENEYFKLATNQKQGKPFLLHILKKFGFEIRDTSRYSISSLTIYICSSTDLSKKYILFKSGIHAEDFKKSSFFKRDNYIIIDKPSEEHQIIDQVLTPKTYHLLDSEKALIKTKKYPFRIND